MPKINFYINYKEDLNYVLKRLIGIDPAGKENRLRKINFDVKVFTQIEKAQTNEEKFRILDNYLKEFYKKHQKLLLKVKNHYQKIWDKLSPLFFNEVSTQMDGYPWKFKTYDFLVSSYFSRASWGTSNKLGVSWYRDPKKHYFMNAYELILTHYFEIVDQIYNKRPLSNWYLWALAEITACHLIYMESPIKNKFWPDLNINIDNFGYKQLIKPIKDLHPHFTKRKSYKEYVEKGVGYIQKYSENYIKGLEK